ncbi:MAG: DnaJ domain-containing protein [Desulfomonilia bacterium]
MFGVMKKVITILAGLVYALSPYDFLPDFLIGWGWLDDILILYLLWRYVLSPNRKPFTFWKNFQKTAGRSSSGTAGASRSRSDDTGTSSQGHEQEETDPYRILGVPPGSSREEITRAYRQLAGKYHPDKVQHLGEEFRTLAEQRFKEIQRAYSYLMDRVRA